MHIITNLQPNIYVKHISIVIVINTTNYLNIQYRWVGMNPTHLVVLNRLSLDSVDTDQSFKLKTKCDRSLSTMRQ